MNIEVLGRGAHSTVAKINHAQHGECAVKRFDVCNDDTGLSVPLVRELYILMHLKHANIVRMFEVMRTEDNYMLLMEALPRTLRDAMDHGRFSGLETRRCIFGMLKGLAYLHGTWDVIHRDVKPENVLLDKDGTPKLSDFGLSRFELQGRAGRYTPDMVTLFYRAPELLSQQHYSRLVDVWSVGCVWCELITGWTLFYGRSELEVLAAIHAHSFDKAVAILPTSEDRRVARRMIAWRDDRAESVDLVRDPLFADQTHDASPAEASAETSGS